MSSIPGHRCRTGWTFQRSLDYQLLNTPVHRVQPSQIQTFSVGSFHLPPNGQRGLMHVGLLFSLFKSQLCRILGFRLALPAQTYFYFLQSEIGTMKFMPMTSNRTTYCSPTAGSLKLCYPWPCLDTSCSSLWIMILILLWFPLSCLARLLLLSLTPFPPHALPSINWTFFFSFFCDCTSYFAFVRTSQMVVEVFPSLLWQFCDITALLFVLTQLSTPSNLRMGQGQWSALWHCPPMLDWRFAV